MNKIRLLIADDSLLFREMLKKQLSEDPRIEVVGIAIDGNDTLSQAARLKPDVISLDVEMPKVNGIELLKKMIPQNPIPVVVVTGSAISAFDAIASGAVDFIRKPTVKGPKDLEDFSKELAAKIKTAAIAKVKASSAATSPVKSIATILKGSISKSKIIAIGASTGGTEAVLEVVKNLPKNSPGVVITQHMPAVFTNMYAQRLNRICSLEVKEAKDGDRVLPGTAIVAAGEFQMKLLSDANGYYVSSKPGDKVSGHCPSVDVLFSSVAKSAGRNAVGVILTGMGADGAKGLLEMKNKGAYTIGQDEQSCIVYGMPMEAFKLGAVKTQLSLSDIAPHIVKQFNNEV